MTKFIGNVVWYIVILFPLSDPKVDISRLVCGEIGDSDQCTWLRSS